MPDQSIYEYNGYKDRRDYLACMADDYGLDFEQVLAMAHLLGPNEDFDGLVVALEDMSDWME